MQGCSSEDETVPRGRGVQNNVRYAYFPRAPRLAGQAIEQTWVCDTLEYQPDRGPFTAAGHRRLDPVFEKHGVVNLATLLCWCGPVSPPRPLLPLRRW